jgi:hypothetical protein
MKTFFFIVCSIGMISGILLGLAISAFLIYIFGIGGDSWLANLLLPERGIFLIMFAACAFFMKKTRARVLMSIEKLGNKIFKPAN